MGFNNATDRMVMHEAAFLCIQLTIIHSWQFRMVTMHLFLKGFKRKKFFIDRLTTVTLGVRIVTLTAPPVADRSSGIIS